jgi:membrane dipeptidase
MRGIHNVDSKAVYSECRCAAALAVFAICVLLVPGTRATAQNASSSWLLLQRNAVVVDGHSDYLLGGLRNAGSETGKQGSAKVLTSLIKGGVDVQFYAVWVSEEQIAARKAVESAMKTIAAFDAYVELNKDRVAHMYSIGDVERNPGRHLAVLSVEGAAGIAETREQVLTLYKRGVRCLGLTWNNSNSLAVSAMDEQKPGRRAGLTVRGRDIVSLCDSLGIIIDVSHMGSSAVRDLLSVPGRPRINSHTACAAIRPHFRNMPDEELKAVAGSGGVVMITFVPGFLRKGEQGKAAKFRARFARLRKEPLDDDAAMARRIKVIEQARMAGLVTVLDVVDHIEHALKVAGDDHVGIGSDFGALDSTPIGLADASDIPMITYLLRKRGHPDGTIRKVLGGNILRVFGEICG